jgi:hypothetical protein
VLKNDLEKVLLNNLSGNSEDENVNFFLTVAELQKINEAMRQQVRLTEKNLQSTNQEIEGISKYCKDLNTGQIL